MKLSDTVVERMGIEQGIARLDAEYWHRVDQPQAGKVSELYAWDGRMVFGDLMVRNRDAIDAFFQARNSSQPVRTTRHISSNLRFEHLGDHRVRVHSTVTVYSGLGPPPLQISPPSSVVQFTDVCAWQHNRWLYEARCGVAVFVGAAAAPFLLAQLPADHPYRRAQP